MITTISVQELNKKYKLDQSNSNFLTIDVREPIEYAHEHIPNSINLPMKQLASGESWASTCLLGLKCYVKLS